ncbi:hypothetical protein BDE02_06G102900 [Populus trichocarpa]|nr:hypothetical protein BDE02_06G102900 [Populus trichocarpa]
MCKANSATIYPKSEHAFCDGCLDGSVQNMISNVQGKLSYNLSQIGTCLLRWMSGRLCAKHDQLFYSHN